MRSEYGEESVMTLRPIWFSHGWRTCLSLLPFLIDLLMSRGMFSEGHMWANAMTYLATIMFPSDHLLRLMLAFSGMDFGLFVLNYLWGGGDLPVYMYYTIGLVASGYLCARGIPCFLYINDRLNGELVTSQGPWSVLSENRGQEYRYSAAIAAIVLCSVAPSWSWIHYRHCYICAVSDHQCGAPRVNDGFFKASINRS